MRPRPPARTTRRPGCLAGCLLAGLVAAAVVPLGATGATARVVVGAGAGAVAAPAGADVDDDPVPAHGWQWPLRPQPRVVAPFDPPAAPYGPGHRGVDLAGAVGQPVHAVAAGRVTFAGQVGGRGVVVVDHGRLSSTYQPVVPRVRRGDTVHSGQPLATLTVIGSHCLPLPCLHLGARAGESYLDPLGLLALGPVRLLPLSDSAGVQP